MADRRTGNLMTQEQYKELQRYFLLEHKACVDNYDKDAFQRLQLRLLCLMLGQLHGNPTVEELIDTRHSDIKAYKMDMNAPDRRILSVGEEGTGPHTMMYIRSGPDVNGMFVSFSAALHKDPNLCCIGALGDLLMYESNPGSPDPGIYSWVADNSKPVPYLFHAFEDPTTPLTKEWVRAELSKGLAVIAGTDVCVDDIGRSSVMWMLNAGVSEQQATLRCLAPPLPQVPQGEIDRLLGMDFLFTLGQLKKDFFQAAPWKLQEFGERWPLTRFDLMHSSEFKKYVTKTMREVNSLSGCAGCGAKEEEGTGALLKCSRCRLVVYCNRECQRAHWSTHKPECKPLVPSKKEIKQKKKLSK